MKIQKLTSLVVLAGAFFLINACTNPDIKRVEAAEAALTVNYDSAMSLLREVLHPEDLPDPSKALYWYCIADIHSNTMQSLSEDSMICWAADWYRQQWLREGGDARHMMLTGLEEALYWWWNGDKERTQQVLQRQQGYAAEVAEQTGDHIWEVVLLRVSGEIAMRDYDFERVRDYTETLIGLETDQAIHLDEVVRVYNALAIVYFSLGEYDRMEQCFQKALADRSDSVFITDVVTRNYADLLGEIGQTDRAIRMHEQLAEQYRQADNWLLVESLYSLSRLWLNKGDKQRANRCMQEAEQLFAQYKADSVQFDPATEAALLAHRQVLDYALKGTYSIYPLVQYNNRWSESDYVRYRIAEAKERSVSDLREQVLRQQLARQRQMILIAGLVLLVLILCWVSFSLYRRRQRLLVEKEEEIETLRNMLSASDNPDNEESVRKLMLQQLGILKTIAGTPTEANQQLLTKLMAINEDKADALIDWPSIYQTIDLVYDGFYTNLVGKYGPGNVNANANDNDNDNPARPVLNEKELQLCCLLKAGFSTKEINMLTRQSLQTVYQRKTQVRQKLNLPEGEDITAAL